MFIPGKTGGSADRKATNDLRQLQGQMTGGYGSTYGGRQTTVPKTDMGKININAQNLWNLYTDNAAYAGRQAAMDTAGTQIAQTEGYGNSWAKQQAGNAYLDYLNNLNGNMNAIVQSATPRTGGGKKRWIGTIAGSIADIVNNYDNREQWAQNADKYLNQTGGKNNSGKVK